jgi:hypothetical protein
MNFRMDPSPLDRVYQATPVRGDLQACVGVHCEIALTHLLLQRILNNKGGEPFQIGSIFR